MKLFSAAQIKACEDRTLQLQQITSLELMERAAFACFEWMQDYFPEDSAFLILCGMGNNGGDGLALTRILLQAGFSAKAIVLRTSDQFAENTSENLRLLHSLFPENIQIFEEGQLISDLPQDIILVDALFGIGLNRPLQGWVETFIQEINDLTNTKVAIDIPSGLPQDQLPFLDKENNGVLRADFTLSFQFLKRSFLHAEVAEIVGKIILLDIGLDANYILETPCLFQTIDLSKIHSLWQPRKDFSNKGDFGTVHLIGGSYGKIGAIFLSAQAALRSGAGKVFVHAPSCGYSILQIGVPEAMFESCGEKYLEFLPQFDHAATIGIGPGLGLEKKSIETFHSFLTHTTNPLVIDADALNILSKQKNLFAQIPHGSILTPHPKEFSRLFGESGNTMNQVEAARHNAMKYNIIIVLKNHHTVVALPDGNCYYNLTGNSGMATGGSGDVLTGILTSLLAQQYLPQHAALLGVYLHGLAGDLALEESSKESLIAGDLPRYLGKAFNWMETKTKIIYENKRSHFKRGYQEFFRNAGKNI